MTRKRTEFAVVGGGLLGLSTAWALTRRGHDVLVLEQHGIGDLRSGSHGACRVFRVGYEEPRYVSLARQARGLWTELEDASGERLLHPVPQLTFGPSMPQVRDAMRAAGADHEVLSASEAADRFPGVAVSGEVLFEPDSAVIAADRTLTVLAENIGSASEAAVRSGAAGSRTGTVSQETRVTGLADDGRTVRVSTSSGQVSADRVIVCAGPWTAGLLAPAGIAIPAEATMEQVAYLAPADESAAASMPIFIHYGGEFPYGLPVPGSHQYKIGLHHSGPPVLPDQQDHSANADLSQRIETVTRRFLPGYDPRPVTVERCVYDNTPDTDFVVDRIGNVVVGCGTSGHGFKFGPLLGEWLAALAVHGKPAAAASPLAALTGQIPRRFAVSRFPAKR